LVQAAALVVLDIDLTHPPGNPVDVAGVDGPRVSQNLTLPEGKRFYRFAH
jgi:hypothetical protein